MKPGDSLGPYRILEKLGAGGMGEVYRARDTRLDRDVALKILPAFFADDPDRLMRFEREAKTLAALNHPNIAHIHGLEESPSTGSGQANSVLALVMELVEGEDLAARVARGPLPLDEALSIARQVVDALETAHDAGIIHRDLKPANIRVRPDGTAKVLDFGLAKTMVPAALSSGSGGPPNDPTFTSPAMTEMGLILGTAAYMSPEQAKGKPADRRADIWAFGVILFEMLAGRRPFVGEGISEMLASVLKDDVDWTALPAGTPAPLLRLLRRCLEKDPRRRLSAIGDARFDLEEAAVPAHAAADGPARSSRRGLPWLALAATAIVGVAVGAAAYGVTTRRDAPPPGRVMRATVPLPNFAASRLIGKDDATMSISPDGRLLAYVTERRTAIVLQDLATGESRTIPQAGEVGAPFFSPDGRFLAYIAGVGGSIRTAVWGSLMKLPLSGGAATSIVDGITGLKGASWGDDGWIYYTPSPAFGLWRVRADGGAPEMLTEPDASKGEKTHRLPFVLPGGRGVLFVVGSTRITSFDDARIEVLRLSDMSRHRLVDGGTAPQYLPTGHLVYQRGGQLLALPFDLERLEVSGVPVPVADGVDYFPPSGTSYHTVAADGTLFYAPRHVPPGPNTLLLIDERGQELKLADAPFNPSSGRVSPDGKRIAVDPDGATQQIAIVDLDRKTIERVTFEWDNASPIWTKDASRLVFRSNEGGGLRRLYWKPSDGSGALEALSTRVRDEIPTSLHEDRLLYEDVDPETRTDIWMMSLDDRRPQPLVRTPADEGGAQFSPDGRWFAYQSNQSGGWEVFVQSAVRSGARLQASQGGGIRPLWDPSGRAVNYLKGVDLMRVSFADGPEPRLGAPVKLFSLRDDDLLLDVMPDGRFVVLRRAPLPPTDAAHVVMNWFEHVRAATAR